MPAKGWIQGLKEACHSWTELVFSLLFDELGYPNVRLRQWTAQRCILLSHTAGRGSGLRGLPIPCYFLPRRGVLRCLILARQTWKLEPRRSSLLCKANVQQKIWVVCQAAVWGDWRPHSVREPFGHSVNCAALGLDVSYEMIPTKGLHLSRATAWIWNYRIQ